VSVRFQPAPGHDWKQKTLVGKRLYLARSRAGGAAGVTLKYQKRRDMRALGWVFAFAVGMGPVLAASVVGAAEGPPLAGCYVRVYDAAHLARHKGQLVTQVTLSVGPASPVLAEASAGDAKPIIADGVLKVRVRGKRQSFDSSGACHAEGSGLLCRGSLSAAEADTCKSKQDGVRPCRIDPADSGSFKVEGQPDGVLVSIRERLELVPAPYDVGPFLSLGPTNTENRAFLLKSEPGACK
jgi:hypothetical protein